MVYLKLWYISSNLMKNYKHLLLASCLFFSAGITIAQEDNRIFINLGENINSESIEINPHISADGKTIYFVRESHKGNKNFQDIWVSELGEDGKWKPSVRLPKPLNLSEANSVVSVSADGNQLLIKGYYKNGIYKGNGYSVTRKSKEWSKPVGLDI